MIEAWGILALGTIAGLVLLDYGVFIFKCRVRAQKAALSIPDVEPIQCPELTVLIPCRDEAANLPLLLVDLQNQSTPVRILVIDDHSNDDTRVAAEAFGVEVIQSPGKGKKVALIAGHHRVKTPWMATVDADTRLGPDWAHSMLRVAISKRASAVLGLVRINANKASGWERFQSQEFGAMMVWISGDVALGKLAMGSGANSLYSTQDYPHQSLHEEIASGDDGFALSALKNEGKVIAWCPESSAFVDTHPANSWKQLWQQRARWASKTQGQDAQTRIVALRIAAIHVLLPIMAFGSVLTWQLDWAILLGTFFILKSVLDGLLIRSAQRLQGVPVQMADYVLFSLRYGLMVWGAWWELFRGQVQWKGRRI